MADSIEKEQGLYAMLFYMNEFMSQTVREDMASDHLNHIIDMGGGTNIKKI